MRRVTIRDVAEHVGCGVATVSRVLNGSGPASAETRARVLAAAEELGFQFNELGRSLQSSRSRTLAVVVPSLLNPVFASAIQGAQAAAAARGYQILLACSDYDEETEASALRTLLAKQVDGALLTISNPDDSVAIDLLRQAGLPYCLMFNQPTRPLPSVGVDNIAAAAMAGKQMIATGHREMAFVALRFRSSERARLRFEGFETCLASAGLPAPALLEVDEHAGDLIDRLRDLLAERPQITALFASNDMLALACIRAARALGREPPRDLSIVGFDGIAITELVEPTLATIATPSARMGEAAAERVIAAINAREKVPARSMVLEFEFRPGASLSRFGTEKPVGVLPHPHRPVSTPDR